MTVLSRGIVRIEPTAMYAARQMGVLKGDDKGSPPLGSLIKQLQMIQLPVCHHSTDAGWIIYLCSYIH